MSRWYVGRQSFLFLFLLIFPGSKVLFTSTKTLSKNSENSSQIHFFNTPSNGYAKIVLQQDEIIHFRDINFQHATLKLHQSQITPHFKYKGINANLIASQHLSPSDFNPSRKKSCSIASVTPSHLCQKDPHYFSLSFSFCDPKNSSGCQNPVNTHQFTDENEKLSGISFHLSYCNAESSLKHFRAVKGVYRLSDGDFQPGNKIEL